MSKEATNHADADFPHSKLGINWSTCVRVMTTEILTTFMKSSIMTKKLIYVPKQLFGRNF